MKKDIRLVELENRESMMFGIKETVGTLVAGGILFMVGFYAYTKVKSSVTLVNGQVANSTHYCAGGTWNGTACDTGVATLLPADYANNNQTLNNISTNITSGFDLGSVIFIVIAAAAIIGVIWLAFR